MPEDEAGVWADFACDLFTRRNEAADQLKEEKPAEDGKLYVYFPGIVAEEERVFLGWLVRMITEDVILTRPPQRPLL